jgi:hypothetical protein
MKLNLNGSEYSLEELAQITGNKQREGYTLEKLKQANTRELNRILRHDLSIPPIRGWDIDTKIAVILFGHAGKCNGYVKNSDKLFCSKSPSKNDKGETNGRCDSHFGKRRSSSPRKQNGRKKGDPTLKNNKNAVKHNLYSRKHKAIIQEIKALYFSKDKDEIENQIERIEEEIADQMALIAEIENELEKPTMIPKLNKVGNEIIDDDTSLPILQRKYFYQQMDLHSAKAHYLKLEEHRTKLIELRKKLNTDTTNTNNDFDYQLVSYAESEALKEGEGNGKE